MFSDSSFFPYTMAVLTSSDGVETQSQADQDGHFVFFDVTPGNYVLTIRQAGYNTSPSQINVCVGTTPVDQLNFMAGHAEWFPPGPVADACPIPKPARLVMSPLTMTLAVGETARASATVYDQFGVVMPNPPTIVWFPTELDRAIVPSCVSQDAGLVTGVTPGQCGVGAMIFTGDRVILHDAPISVTVNALPTPTPTPVPSPTATPTPTPEPTPTPTPLPTPSPTPSPSPSPIPVTSLDVSPNSATLSLGQCKQFSVVDQLLRPVVATWISNNPTLVTVSAGKACYVKKGTAKSTTIYATLGSLQSDRARINFR